MSGSASSFKTTPQRGISQPHFLPSPLILFNDRLAVHDPDNAFWLRIQDGENDPPTRIPLTGARSLAQAVSLARLQDFQPSLWMDTLWRLIPIVGVDK